MGKQKKVTGSLTGFVIVIAIGFAFYFGLNLIANTAGTLNYNYVIDGIESNFGKQILWFFMNFTEPQFYAGIFSGIGVILGGVVAWILAKKNSHLAGFDICYGSSSLFPWVLASQVLSLALAIFVFGYIHLFSMTGSTWIATFITVVGAPPSIMLLYGPSVSALLTSSILASLLSAPMATWISTYIVTPLGVPGVVANVSTMAVVGVVVCYICKILPWVTKKEVVSYRKTPAPAEDVYTAKWFVRRCLAEFTEAQFYGNEVSAVFLLVGAVIDWCVSMDLTVYGGRVLPAVLLSQFVGAAVGVFLYASKFENGGWYATYVPVVSVGPACVLMFGGTIPVALFSGALGGILGAPVADFFATKLPEGVHVTNANVTSMALCTIIVSMVMKFLGIF